MKFIANFATLHSAFGYNIFMVKLLHTPKYLGKGLIRLYQRLFSTDHSFWAKPEKFRICVHYPSCSQYTYESIDKFGLVRGSAMGAARILRCNGLARGGYDPVPNYFTLRPNYQDPNAA